MNALIAAYDGLNRGARDDGDNLAQYPLPEGEHLAREFGSREVGGLSQGQCALERMRRRKKSPSICQSGRANGVKRFAS